ncbi:hypothetical protein HK100_003800 [Physocladia obscura]|uniref:Uncharacterized protein n=1 Tax=Physocladia obscura TaxID=109957 RepID=A0AAD5XDC4_9FUNG|nr:hypothetical protein HK100_003800 [Physocladia obscura]
MPWLAAPCRLSSESWLILGGEGKSGVPQLHLFDAATGELLTTQGYPSIERDSNDHQKELSYFYSGSYAEPKDKENEDSLSSNNLVQRIKNALITAYSNKTEIDNFEVLMISNAKTADEHAAQISGLLSASKFKLRDLSVSPKVVVINSDQAVVNIDAAHAIIKNAPIPFRPLLIGDWLYTDRTNGFTPGSQPFMVSYARMATEMHTLFETILTSLAARVAPVKPLKNPLAGKLICDGASCYVVPNEIPTEEPSFLFYLTTTRNGMTNWCREFAGLSAVETKPDALIINFGTQESYGYTEEMSQAGLRKFFDNFRSGKLKEQKGVKKV